MGMSKLYIPFGKYDFIGGPSSFMFNLKTYLETTGFKYSNNEKGAKNIFFPIEYNVDILNQIQKKKGAIIQRLDGVFYPEEHSKEQLEFNETIRKIYLDYSTHIVFQSEYSKKQCFYSFGEKKTEDYSIIINGVDKNLFFPSTKVDNPPVLGVNFKIKFISTGNFRRKEMLEPVIKALDEVNKDFPIEFNIVGPVKDEYRYLIDRDYINYLGKKNLSDIGKLLRENHIFLFSFLNPACPNSVIEAISTGLPVVSFNSGSIHELLDFNKDLLANVSKDLFQKSDDLDYRKLKEKILLCITNFDKYKQISLNNSYLFGFEECGAEYVKVFNNQLSQKKGNILKTIFR